MKELKSISEYESVAKILMPSDLEECVNAGEGLEVTKNQLAFNKIKLLPKVMINALETDLKVDLLGGKLQCSFPVGIAPASFHRAAHSDGEMGTARAAKNTGTLYIQSGAAGFDIEDIAREAPDTKKWFQMKLFKDRDINKDLLLRAESNGFSAIVLTVDPPNTGKQNTPNLKGPLAMNYPELDFCKNIQKYVPSNWKGNPATFAFAHFSKSIYWDDIEWLKSVTALPIILKGILRADDALKASQMGVAGIIVSNHSGRIIEGVISTMEALPGVVSALKGSSTEVYLDGGVRTGEDVFRALALGAKMVFLGRPIFWGLAVNGQDGVEKILGIIKEELKRMMIIAGCPAIKAIDGSFIYKSPTNSWS